MAMQKNTHTQATIVLFAIRILFDVKVLKTTVLSLQNRPDDRRQTSNHLKNDKLADQNTTGNGR